MYVSFSRSFSKQIAKCIEMNLFVWKTYETYLRVNTLFIWELLRWLSGNVPGFNFNGPGFNSHDRPMSSQTHKRVKSAFIELTISPVKNLTQEGKIMIWCRSLHGNPKLSFINGTSLLSLYWHLFNISGAFFLSLLLVSSGFLLAPPLFLSPCGSVGSVVSVPANVLLLLRDYQSLVSVILKLLAGATAKLLCTLTANLKTNLPVAERSGL